MNQPKPLLTGLNHITLAVSGLQRSIDFYQELLGMTLKARWSGGAYLLLGDLWVCLSVDEARPADDYTHIALSCNARDFPAWRARLVAADVGFFKDNLSEGDSLYFLDPDGHKLEIHVGNIDTRLDAMKPADFSDLVIY